MASCDIQSVLDEGKCYVYVPKQMRLALMAQILCQIRNEIASGGQAEAFFVMQSDDGLWYELSAFEIIGNVATLEVGQTPVSAGTQAYRVITDVSDSLKYKVRLVTLGDGTVDYEVEQTPTGEAATDTIFQSNGGVYRLKLVTDEGVVTTWLDPL